MNVCVHHVYIHICICMRICVLWGWCTVGCRHAWRADIYIYIYIYMEIYVTIYICKYIFLYMYVYINSYIYICICIYVNIYMYIYVYICTYIHINIIYIIYTNIPLYLETPETEIKPPVSYRMSKIRKKIQEVGHLLPAD